MHPRRMHRPPRRRAPSTTATRSPRPAAVRAALNPVEGLQHDRGVQHDREVPDVVEVVLELPERVLDAGAVAVVNLRPPGDPGLHQVAEVIAWNVALVLAHQPVPFRAGADEAHLAPED